MFSIFQYFLNISFQIFCFQSHLKDLYFFISTFPNFHVEHILSVYKTYLSSTFAVKLLLRCFKLLPIPYLIDCLFTITQKIWWLHYQNIWWLFSPYNTLCIFAYIILNACIKFLTYSLCFIRNLRLLLALFWYFWYLYFSFILCLSGTLMCILLL